MSKAPFANCTACPLKDEPVVFGRGPVGASLAIVGEAPGKTEVREGMPFIGQSGKLLSGVLEQIGVDESDVWITNTVLCRCVDATGKNRPPTAQEAECCRPRLIDELKDAQRIVTLGGTAHRSILPQEAKSKITAIRGKVFKTELLPQADVVPSFHPAFILRKHQSFPELRADLMRGLISDAKPQLQNYTTWIATTSADACDFILAMIDSESAHVVADLETTGLNFLTGKIICLVLCADPKDVFIIPAKLMNAAAIRLLKRLFGKKIITGHNLKFDLKFMAHEWATDFPTETFDTMLAHYALDERKGTNGLKAICSARYAVSDWEIELKVQLKKLKLSADSETNGYDLIESHLLHTYASADGHYTRRLATDLLAELVAQPRLLWLFEHIISPAANVFGEMEMTGVRLDAAHLQRLADQWEKDLESAIAELTKIVGHEFNPRSPQQLCKIMYDEMDLPVQIKKDTGKPTTDEAALIYLLDTFDMPFLHLLLAYRKKQKLMSTYVLPLIEQARIDGRAHSTFNLNGTITGRISSEDINLLNIPTRSEDGKQIKKGFIADPGMTLVQGDLKGAEVCAIAFYSRDQAMMALLRAGIDIHGEVAKATFGPDYTKAQRQTSKVTFFGRVYGQMAKSLAIRLRHDLIESGVAKDQREVMIVVQRIIAAINRMFPEVHRWQQRTIAQAFKRGGIETFFGRRRRYPFINDQAEKDLRNQILDYQAQSTASDVVQLALIEFAPIVRKLGGKCLLSVYDSIMCQVPDAMVERTVRAMAEIMVDIPHTLLGTDVRWSVEISTGKVWGELQ